MNLDELTTEAAYDLLASADAHARDVFEIDYEGPKAVRFQMPVALILAVKPSVSRTPRVTIIAGPNGAGKSTVAPLLLRTLRHQALCQRRHDSSGSGWTRARTSSVSSGAHYALTA